MSCRTVEVGLGGHLGSVMLVCFPLISFLSCSLDDDSDVHSPRYSFSDDSK